MRERRLKRSHNVKQVLNINGYTVWLINSIPKFQPSPESTISVFSDDTTDDVGETEIEINTQETYQ